MSRRVLVTGAAGFIGSSVTDSLIAAGDVVVGIDNFDPYYDPTQKQRNIQRALASERYRFFEADVRNADQLRDVFDRSAPDAVVHLAARAGVRASVVDPLVYAEVNEIGGLRVLMECQARGNIPLVFASTSSVYGKSTALPFREDDDASTPLSPYAASKRASELMAFSFHEVHQLPVAILRFFTVYGPRGRPDMAFYKFTAALLANTPILLHGESTERDFTYVDDIVAGVMGALEWVIRTRGFDTFNLGRSEPMVVRHVIELLGKALARSPRIEVGQLEPGEAHRTAADVGHARALLGYSPRVSIEEGVTNWVDWLRHSQEAPSLLRGR